MFDGYIVVTIERCHLLSTMTSPRDCDIAATMPPKKCYLRTAANCLYNYSIIDHTIEELIYLRILFDNHVTIRLNSFIY